MYINVLEIPHKEDSSVNERENFGPLDGVTWIAEVEVKCFFLTCCEKLCSEF